MMKTWQKQQQQQQQQLEQEEQKQQLGALLFILCQAWNVKHLNWVETKAKVK